MTGLYPDFTVGLMVNGHAARRGGGAVDALPVTLFKTWLGAASSPGSGLSPGWPVLASPTDGHHLLEESN